MALSNFALNSVGPLDITSGKFDPKGFGEDSGLQNIGDASVKNFGELKQKVFAANPNVGSASDYYRKMADAMQFIDPVKAMEFRAKSVQAQNTQQATQNSEVPSQQLVGAGISNLAWNPEQNVPIVQSGATMGLQNQGAAMDIIPKITADLSRVDPMDQVGRDSVLSSYAKSYPALWPALSQQFPREATKQNYDTAMQKGGMGNVVMPIPGSPQYVDYYQKAAEMAKFDYESLHDSNPRDPRLPALAEKARALSEQFQKSLPGQNPAENTKQTSATQPAPITTPLNKNESETIVSHKAKNPLYAPATAKDIDTGKRSVEVAPTPIISSGTEDKVNLSRTAAENFDRVKTKTLGEINAKFLEIPSQGDKTTSAYKSLESKQKAIEEPNSSNLVNAFPTTEAKNAALSEAGISQSLFGGIMNTITGKAGSDAVNLTDQQKSKLLEIIKRNYAIDYKNTMERAGAIIDNYSMKDLAKFHYVDGRPATAADRGAIKAYMLKKYMAPLEVHNSEKSSGSTTSQSNQQEPYRKLKR